MGESAPLTGPDLGKGIASADLAEGRPLLGRLDGEAVMLVRSGSAVYATGASCTHYGGPLAEGLVVGTTVRCPWHHACFDLKTGRASGPALNPLPCYDVVEEGALLRVVGKRAESKGAAVATPASVVVVGGGPAGAACVETLRREGYTGPITLIADEPPGPVDRPNLSKDYLAGKAPEEWIALRGEDFYRENEIDFVLGDAAASIDTAARNVTLRSGRVLPYGALLLATGASPRKLDVPGGDLPHVLTLRTVADSRAIIARAKKGARAVVVGASFIGLEVAASLRARELSVDVVGPEAIPLARVLGDELGKHVRGLHEAQGVTFRLGRKPTSIDAASVTLDDGTVLAADLVVVGVGVAPRVELAQAAGLSIDKGIVVDDHLRTSNKDVWAAGDVARFPCAWFDGLVRIEHFAVAERQGQYVAKAILGLGDGYRDVPFFWSAHYDQTLAYVGHAESWDRIRTLGSIASGSFAAAYEKAGKILAVVTLGDDALALRAEAAIEARDDAALLRLFAASSEPIMPRGAH